MKHYDYFIVIFVCKKNYETFSNDCSASRLRKYREFSALKYHAGKPDWSELFQEQVSFFFFVVYNYFAVQLFFYALIAV